MNCDNQPAIKIIEAIKIIKNKATLVVKTALNPSGGANEVTLIWIHFGRRQLGNTQIDTSA